ncbi:MAG TPA: hypothetical protein DDW62_07270 [Marinilabiliaceae bacterium]|nr:hypothetical protein [Marinilabiliaceae bacterium]
MLSKIWGVLYFVLKDSLRAKSFFISWDNNVINYHFPKNKQLETIKIEEIQSLEISESKIEINMKNHEIKNINLDLVFLPKRKYIIEYFEWLESELHR